MRVMLILVLSVCAAALPKAQETTNSAVPILKLHFLGRENLVAGVRGTPFGEIAEMKSLAALTEQTLEKLSRAPYELLRERTAVTNDFSALFRPLMDDLLNVESVLEIRASDSGTPELSLALRMDRERAALWKTNLGTALNAWSGVAVRDVTVDNNPGWEIKKHHRPNLLRVVYTGQWIVLGLGHDELPLQLEWLAFLKAHPLPQISPVGAVLDVEMNFAALSRWITWPESSPRGARLFWSPKEQTVQANLTFSKALGNPAPWRLPTNLIHGPVLSFTAARAPTAFLDGISWAANAGTMPDQFFTWTVARSPLGAFFAAPVTNASQVFARIVPQIQTLWDRRMHSNLPGNLLSQTNKIIWSGLPFLAPFIESVHQPESDFLFGGVTQNTTNGSPPLKLLSQLQAQSNRLYYHWESTRARAERWQNMAQLFLLMTQRPLPPTNSAGGLWLSELASKLTETETQITLSGSNKLVLRRQGVPGLTGLELIALANWLEMTNFPWCGFRVPSRNRLSTP